MGPARLLGEGGGFRGRGDCSGEWRVWPGRGEVTPARGEVRPGQLRGDTEPDCTGCCSCWSRGDTLLGDWTLAGWERRDCSVISSPDPLLAPCPGPLCTDGSCEAAGLRLELTETACGCWPPDTSRSSSELPELPELPAGRGLSAAGVLASSADRTPQPEPSHGEARDWCGGPGEVSSCGPGDAASEVLCLSGEPEVCSEVTRPPEPGAAPTAWL